MSDRRSDLAELPLTEAFETEKDGPSASVTASEPAGSPPGEDDATRPARRRRRVPRGVLIGGGYLALWAVVAIAAPLVAPGDPYAGQLTERLQSVGSSGHLLGTDGLGRDVLTRLIWGARPSLIAGVVPVVIACCIGVTLGMISSMRRGWARVGIMRSLDVIYAFPAVLLAIAIAAALGPGIMNAIAALSIVMIVPIARVTETEVNRIRDAGFLEAARTSGASGVTIAFRQVLPNLLPIVLVYGASLVGLAIVFSAGLAFLGLGVAPPQPEWGQMLNDLRQHIYEQPWLALVPAALILSLSLACNALGDGLRDLLDVRNEAELR